MRQGTWRELAASGGIGRFVLICLGVYLHAADSLVTATLVPAIVGDVGGIAYVGWTISLYQIGAVILGSATALLCRRAGVRRVLIAAALLYGAGCVLAAMAPAMAVLLAGRLIQGMAGGALIALSSIAIQQSFPEHLWGRLFGINALVWSAGSLLGPLIGGVFADLGAWRLAFWSFALQAGLVAAFASFLLPEREGGARAPGGYSWPALAALSAGIVAIAEAGVAASDAGAVAIGLVGLLLLWLAARLDRSSASRMLPRAALDLSHPIGRGLLMVLALSVATTGFWAYGPLILKTVFGTDPLISGYILAGEAFAWTFGTIAVSGLSSHWGRALIRAGAMLVFLGGSGFALAVPSGSLVAIIVCVALHGVGFGMSWPSIMQLLVRCAPAQEATLAAAAPGTVQRIGYSVGAAVSGIVANAAGLADGISPAAAEAAGLWVFAGFIPILALGAICAFLFTREETAPARAISIRETGQSHDRT